MPANVGKPKFNGGLDGHSEKWSNKNRPRTSFNAGQGNRGSRNQGTGQAGIENTLPSDAIDTTKMSPIEKLKYFQSLNLVPTGSSQIKEEENNYQKDIDEFTRYNFDLGQEIIIAIIDACKRSNDFIKALDMVENTIDQADRLELTRKHKIQEIGRTIEEFKNI